MTNFDGLLNSQKVANVEKVRHVLNYCDDKCASACVDGERFQLQWTQPRALLTTSGKFHINQPPSLI